MAAAALARDTHRSPSRRSTIASDKGKAKRVPTAKPKTEPMSFRMDVETRLLVDRAASIAGQNRTEFMLTALREKATEILLNQRLFTLNESDWATFVDRLDNPPPPNAKLKALLARVPIWDRQ
jgi:uncharacterized protein (DUF1778 family)